MTPRRLGLTIFLLVTLAFSCAPVAHAQIFSIYGTYSPTRFSNIQTGSVYSNGAYHEQTTSFWTSGVGGGVTLRLLPLGPVSLGLDLRGSTRPGTVGADTAFGGIKLGLHLPHVPIKPYIQGSVGYIATRTVNISSVSPNSSATIGGTFGNDYAAYEILGGVDYSLRRFIDIRLIEVGGGSSFAALLSTGNTSFLTVNTGIVFHF